MWSHVAGAVWVFQFPLFVLSEFEILTEETVFVSEAGPSMEDPKVASELCVGADCSSNLDFQNGPPITVAGSPSGRPKL
ncbi:hypothetical protein Nepgr_027230 [Nepenthes gracilis]|uniref:Secreted protein n=1 Tax=Nepenthes gracilis TaxID=150966 RepID=A0AAD3T9N7_NEPGR|nr:hypothetical protein Nepgr_027230 [Nepenthes gracilis]